MKDQEQRTYDRLLEKSQEAFLLAIELYNRPTIKYHVEGCSFFLCNAWELMLKAFIIKRDGERAIYYKDNPERTISLNNCIDSVFTNRNDPLRINLLKINDLRNTSTHFVTEEFEIFYGPLFQVAVKNYDEKLKEFHGREVSDIIPESYLILSVKRDIIDPEKIRAKYSPEVAEKLLMMNNSVATAVGDEGSARYAGYYETNFVITKDAKKADLAVRIDSKASAGVAIVKEVQKVQDKYPFTTNMAIDEVKRRLTKAHIVLLVKGEEKDFNKYHWQGFVDFYALKGDERYSYNRSLEAERMASYVYSQQAVELVFDALKRDPGHAIDMIIQKNKEKSRPQEQGNSRSS